MAERYEQAWAVPGSDGGGVLVRVGGVHPYWWVLCPASATLYPNAVEHGCSLSPECDYPEIHHDAARLAAEVSDAT